MDNIFLQGARVQHGLSTMKENNSAATKHVKIYTVLAIKDVAMAKREEILSSQRRPLVESG
jgi:hypothetical protein